MARWTYRPQNRCRDCGYTWFPRGRNLSVQCPNCASRATEVVSALPGFIGLAIIIVSGVVVWNQINKKEDKPPDQPVAIRPEPDPAHTPDKVASRPEPSPAEKAKQRQEEEEKQRHAEEEKQRLADEEKKRQEAEAARKVKEKEEAEAKAKQKEAEEREKIAARKLDFAKSVLSAGKKERAKERLEEIIKEFPETKAAQEAMELLKKQK